MKILRLLFLFLLLSAGARAASADFVKANEAYAAGDFPKAKQLYTAALAEKPDENAWFNLGNTSFRLGEPGPAALAYERALALAPGHAAAEENLKFVRQKTGARVNERSWIGNLFGPVPPALSPWIAVGVAWLGFIWIGAAWWRRTGKLGIIGGALLVLIGGAYGAGLAWWKRAQQQEAVVIVESATVRGEPSAVSQSTTTLPAGSRVRLISGIGGWKYGELSNGVRGWLSEKDVETIVPPRS